MITLKATGRKASARATEPITTGSVGIPVEVELSADFDGLQAIMVFSCGHTHADVALMEDAVAVPAQLLRVAGQHLHVGVYATLADGTVVIPTVWADAGTVQQGVAPSGVDPASPAPSWAAQVQAVAREAAELSGAGLSARVASLDETQLAVVGSVVEAHGAPTYVSDVGGYESYGITEPGWYVFARIAAPEGASFVSVEGADGSVAGGDHVDVAVRFEVAAQSVPVTIRWDGDTKDVVTFRATDLAIRNMDYRVTFYVYDLTPFTMWEYAPTADATFAANASYYTLGEDGETYEIAEVTAGEAVPAVYYTLGEDGETYELVTGGVFAGGTSYYTKSGTAYVAAEVAAGETVPTVYYRHSKVTFAGMVRNVTYRCDSPIDCPATIVLPAIPDDGYGAWYDFQFYAPSSQSLTLQMLDPDAKAASNGFGSFGGNNVNMTTLHYTSVAGKKLWRATNIAANIPA